MGHVLNYLITPETRRAHRARWFVWGWDFDGSREKLPHNARMRGTWGWDVECSCGWKSRTGGATRGSVEDELWDHRHAAQADAEEQAADPESPALSGAEERQELWTARAKALLEEAIRQMERIDVLDLVTGAEACLRIAVGELDPSEMDGYENLLDEEER